MKTKASSEGCLTINRALALVAVVFLAAVLVPSTAKADAKVSYVERSWDGGKVVSKDKSATGVTWLDSNTTSWGSDSGAWYAVSGEVTIGDRVNVSGTANLILCDGATLSANMGITNNETTLNIYAQQGDTGKLVSECTDYSPGGAGIGGTYKSINEPGNCNGGTVRIHGGTVEARGSHHTAGIGGGFVDERDAKGGEVTIYGGTVRAWGGGFAAGIGGGRGSRYGGSDGGKLTVYGGTVEAWGGFAAAGIGGGHCGKGGEFSIYGGSVTATGGAAQRHDSKVDYEYLGGGAGIGGGGGFYGVVYDMSGYSQSTSGGAGAVTTISGGSAKGTGGASATADNLSMHAGADIGGGGGIYKPDGTPVKGRGDNSVPATDGANSPTATATVQIWRLYNPNSGEHFLTASSGERNLLVAAGWRDEGAAWVAPNSSSSPVYRLYNINGGDHHYTISAGERNLLVAAGWRDEGVGWYSDVNKRVAVYRAYNPNALTGAHHFTTSAGEIVQLVAAGWNDEGIGWYAVA